MKRQGRDWLGVALAAAGVVGAISLAGIFIVYLVDSIGGDDNSKPASTQVGVRTGPTAATGPTGANAGTGTTGSSNSKKSAGKAKAGATGQTGAAAKIPDGQRYETFTNRTAGYSILVPKGWKKRTKGKLTTFGHAPNFLIISSAKGRPPTVKTTSAIIAKNKKLVIVEAPREATVGGNAAVIDRVRNTERDVLIDQYHFGKSKKVAAINLGTPEKVASDNADDFRRIANSFRWL
jgi:hypothetical protein